MYNTRTLTGIAGLSCKSTMVMAYDPFKLSYHVPARLTAAVLEISRTIGGLCESPSPSHTYTSGQSIKAVKSPGLTVF